MPCDTNPRSPDHWRLHCQRDNVQAAAVQIFRWLLQSQRNSRTCFRSVLEALAALLQLLCCEASTRHTGAPPLRTLVLNSEAPFVNSGARLRSKLALSPILFSVDATSNAIQRIRKQVKGIKQWFKLKMMFESTQFCFHLWGSCVDYIP